MIKKLTYLQPFQFLKRLIDSKLNWKNHYTNIIKKSNSTLAFLKRNLSKSPEFVKKTCYTTLVRPQLEYASAIWDPHQTTYIDLLEKVQKRGARFVTSNYKMETGNSQINLDHLEWPTLEERRLQTKLNIFQKARLELIDIPTDHLIEQTRQSARLGGEGIKYHREFSKINGHIYSFFPHTSHLWSNLPSDTRTCKKIDQFLFCCQFHGSNLIKKEIISFR